MKQDRPELMDTNVTNALLTISLISAIAILTQTIISISPGIFLKAILKAPRINLPNDLDCLILSKAKSGIIVVQTLFFLYKYSDERLYLFCHLL